MSNFKTNDTDIDTQFIILSNTSSATTGFSVNGTDLMKRYIAAVSSGTPKHKVADTGFKVKNNDVYTDLSNYFEGAVFTATVSGISHSSTYNSITSSFGGDFYYVISKTTDNTYSNTSTPGIASSSSGTTTLSSLSTDTQYTFKLTPYDGKDNAGTASSNISYYTLPNLSITSIIINNPFSVTFTWTGANTINIAPNGSSAYFITLNTSSSPYTFYGLNARNSYIFNISPYNRNDNSLLAASTSSTYTTLSIPYSPITEVYNYVSTTSSYYNLSNILIIPSGFSISFYVYMNNTSGGMRFCKFTSPNFSSDLYITSGDPFIVNAYPGNRDYLPGYASINTSFMITMVFVSGSPTIYYYNTDSTAGHTYTWTNTETPTTATIGINGGTSVASVDGTFYNFRYYNYALSSDQVNYLYYNGKYLQYQLTGIKTAYSLSNLNYINGSNSVISLNSTGFTIAFGYKRTNYSSATGKLLNITTSSYTLILYNNANSNNIYSSDGSFTTNVNNNIMIHIAIVVTPGITTKYYVNGNYVATKTSAASWPTSTTTAVIGGNASDSTNGYYPYFQFHQEAKTDDQIDKLYLYTFPYSSSSMCPTITTINANYVSSNTNLKKMTLNITYSGNFIDNFIYNIYSYDKTTLYFTNKGSGDNITISYSDLSIINYIVSVVSYSNNYSSNTINDYTLKLNGSSSCYF